MSMVSDQDLDSSTVGYAGINNICKPKPPTVVA